MPKLLTAKEVASMLGYNRDYFNRQIKSGSGNFPPFILVGKVRRWREQEVMDFVNGNNQ